MKTVGFIKEFDDVIFAKEFKDCITHIYKDNSEIIRYLEKGISFGGWMGAVTEVENEDVFVSNLEYFTDGEWIWPAYYSYYLNKYKNFYVPIEFIEYVSKNQNKVINLKDEELLKIEKIFFKEYKKEGNNEINLIEELEDKPINHKKEEKKDILIQPYKTYKGKNYTEEEWKIFEENLYQEYLRKKREN